MSRPEWSNYFMAIAKQVATRSTCGRKNVGAVIVRDRNILSSGYNGSVKGLPHCDEAGHELVEINERLSCIRTIHAEINAIAQAARNGTNIAGSEIYVTCIPCYECTKVLINAGIVKVYYFEYYESQNTNKTLETLSKAGVWVGPTI